VPLVVVGVANQVVSAVAYGLAKSGVVINGQTAGILTVLVFGAGTDYALLIVARFREELRRHEDRHEAMRSALRNAGPAILASASTVIAGLLCLLIAVENSVSGFGPVSAIGIAVTLACMLTILPALLVALPRGVFWPFVPRYGSTPREERGPWFRIGRRIMARPRPVWAGAVVVLALMAVGLTRMDTTTSQLNSFRSSVESVAGQKILAESFPGGLSTPAEVVVRDPSKLPQVIAAAKETAGVAATIQVQRAAGIARFDAVLAMDPYSDGAFEAMDELRDAVHGVGGAGALVGGETAVNLDSRRAAIRDIKFVLPLVLLVVLVILGLLLRAVLAPVILALTVVLSFAASLGASVLVFRYVFGFDGTDPGLPLLAFIFLVALGVDYNIFLMARVREEAQEIGTRRGMLKGLAVTGGVITSAGVILVGTFSVLGILPLVALTEIGFLVAFGVLLDTLVVRSLLVPALSEELGPRIWWPSRLSKTDGAVEEPERAPVGAGRV
jgi:RND superfamily putative drug exporter